MQIWENFKRGWVITLISFILFLVICGLLFLSLINMSSSVLEKGIFAPFYLIAFYTTFIVIIGFMALSFPIIIIIIILLIILALISGKLNIVLKKKEKSLIFRGILLVLMNIILLMIIFYVAANVFPLSF